MPYNLKIIGGRANPVLCQEICSFIGLEPGQIEITNFMDGETYEQIALSTDAIDEEAPYLADGATVRLSMFEGNPIGIELPAAVELEVTHTEPGVKGDRVSGATKPVTLSTGLVVQAPLFVDIGDTLKVDTRTGDYLTRVL